MSYKNAMRFNLYKHDPTTQRYELEHGSYLNYPLSKNPIRIKLLRAIHDRKSFSNLGSNTGTRIRWVGNFYIVSLKTYSLGFGDAGIGWTGWLPALKFGELDIAVGRQGEYPFVFRSPFAGIPNKKYENPRMSEAEKRRNTYMYFLNTFMYKRLGTLECVCSTSSTKIGEFVNPKTGRKNKISASVPHIKITRIKGITPTAIGDTADDIVGQLVDPTFDPMDETDPRYGTDYSYEYYNKKWNLLKDSTCWVPLLTAGWYFRESGELIKETVNPNVETDDLL